MAEFMADDPDWLRSIARSYPSGPQRARLVAIADAAAAVLAEAAPASCTAAVVLAGEHFPCDWPTDERGKHDGWDHTNKAAQAVWRGAE